MTGDDDAVDLLPTQPDPEFVPEVRAWRQAWVERMAGLIHGDNGLLDSASVKVLIGMCEQRLLRLDQVLDILEGKRPWP